MLSLRRVARAVAISLAVTLVLALTVVWGAAQGGTFRQDMSYRSLKYDASVSTDGDLRFTEHIDMKLNQRPNGKPWRQLFQQYKINDTKLTAITDVSVKDVTHGKTYRLGTAKSTKALDDESWDDDYAGTWYAMDTSDNDQDYAPAAKGETAADSPAANDGKTENDANGHTVEIGWNIPATESAGSLRFDISMTFRGVVSVYNDVSYMQWEPVGDNNEIPIDSLQGHVSLPKSAASGQTWQWLHYDGNGSVHKSANHGVDFSAKYVKAHQHVDLVSMFGVQGMKQPLVKLPDNIDMKNMVLNDERIEAENYQRQLQKRDDELKDAVALALIAMAVAVAMVIYNNRKIRYRGTVDYFRDIPPISPAAAAKLMGVLEPMGNHAMRSRRMSATLLSLASKKLIALYPGRMQWYEGIDMGASSVQQIDAAAKDQNRPRSRKATGVVKILPLAYADSSAQPELADSEHALLDFLTSAAVQLGAKVFDLSQLNDCLKEWSGGIAAKQRFDDAADAEFDQMQLTRFQWQYLLFTAIAVGLIVLAFVGNLALVVYGGIAWMVVFGIPLMFFFVLAIALMQNQELIGSGQQAAAWILGFRKYLEDFSNFVNRDIPDLVLWDKYLVYATAFGISKRLVKELSKAFAEVPQNVQFSDDSNDSLTYRYSVGASDAANTAYGSGLGDLGSQFASGFSDIQATCSRISAFSNNGDGSGDGSGGGFGISAGGGGGGSFGGSGGGSGGGSFGGR
ncbi:DUF2207 domain-containing protein [Bifidobacterium sp. ESL0690]|uniref:DUF2207 domain-containing protein n=1 Tax=Bifidobacterium sp. ESL0690 TaxID=2983214 RepID=UPI0023F76FE7|nr:DUF2207 domain-containing protein [Bifidobacterium sp. ESL0690]WEV46442.1 DUF2207 domain-containing protein [Bifidobacterium sp. ESL0690]